MVDTGQFRNDFLGMYEADRTPRRVRHPAAAIPRPDSGSGTGIDKLWMWRTPNKVMGLKQVRTPKKPAPLNPEKLKVATDAILNHADAFEAQRQRSGKYARCGRGDACGWHPEGQVGRVWTRARKAADVTCPTWISRRRYEVVRSTGGSDKRRSQLPFTFDAPLPVSSRNSSVRRSADRMLGRLKKRCRSCPPTCSDAQALLDGLIRKEARPATVYAAARPDVQGVQGRERRLCGTTGRATGRDVGATGQRSAGARALQRSGSCRAFSPVRGCTWPIWTWPNFGNSWTR